MKYSPFPHLLFIIFPIAASAQVELKAAKAPSGKNLWEQPAQISYLSNTGGESSSAIDAAASTTFPNIRGTTIQTQLTAWIAKNSLSTRKQDKRGIEGSVYMAFGDQRFGYLPQLIISIDRDKIKRTDEWTYEATVDFTSVPLNLGGCGHAASKGCTFWNAMTGFYSNNVRSSADGLGRGHVNGVRMLLQLTSAPFPETNFLAPLSISATAQGQWDRSASSSRAKQNRRMYKVGLGWKFYDAGAKYKPSIALERVLGSDLLTGQEGQAYSRLALRLEI